MTAPVRANPFHRCEYVLWSGGRWISVSSCHYGATVEAPAPGLKRRAA